MMPGLNRVTKVKNSVSPWQLKQGDIINIGAEDYTLCGTVKRVHIGDMFDLIYLEEYRFPFALSKGVRIFLVKEKS